MLKIGSETISGGGLTLWQYRRGRLSLLCLGVLAVLRGLFLFHSIVPGAGFHSRVLPRVASSSAGMHSPARHALTAHLRHAHTQVGSNIRGRPPLGFFRNHGVNLDEKAEERSL